MKKSKGKNKIQKNIKKERKNLSLRLPSNFYFWKWVLEKPQEVQEFVNRGDIKQKTSIKRVLNYIKKKDKEEFERLGGKEWLKKLKV